MKTGEQGSARCGHGSLMSAVLMATVTIGSLVVAPQSHAQAVSPRSFDIAPQALADGLVAFATQSGLQVTTNGAEIRGVRTNGVRGSLAPAQALSQLLAGTGFTFRIKGSLATIERAPVAAGDGVVSLGPVRVEGAGDGGSNGGFAVSISSDPDATEGTGSYTVRTMSSATHLPLTMRQTPQSVTVLTSARIAAENIVDIVDIAKSTPGLRLTANDVRPTIMSRGFAIGNMT